MIKNTKILMCAMFICTGIFCKAQETINSGFEMVSSKGNPRGWTENSQAGNYIIKIDSIQKHEGKFAIMIDGRDFKNASSDSNGAVYNGYGLSSAEKINTIELSAWIKLKTNIDSAADILIQDVKGDTSIRVFVHSSNSEWQKVNLKFTPLSDKPWYGFYYGGEVVGKAAAWFDDIELKIDGKLITNPAGADYEPSNADIQWLNNNLNAIKSVDAANGFEDMQPIGNLCNGATVVGIGEPTHGTNEALRFKLKLLEYLVTKKGFNTIALEENVAVCNFLNNIINTPSASIENNFLAMSSYKLWKSQEVLSMLQWVRTYNQSHVKKLKFIGIDEENTGIKIPRQLLKNYAEGNDKDIYKQALLIDNRYNALRYADSSQSDIDNIFLAANNLQLQLNNMSNILNEKRCGHKINEQNYFNLQSYVRVCQQWLQVKYFTGDRDSCMADNILFYTAHHPHDKLMVWAHNFHISNFNNGVQTMGARLKEIFDDAYIALGFTSSQGSYTAAINQAQQQWNHYSFETAYKGTYEYTFAKAKDSLYFLSMKNGSVNQQGAAWLRMPMKHLDIGYIKADGDMDEYKYIGTMHSIFDGIVFCKTTTPNHSYFYNK